MRKPMSGPISPYSVNDAEAAAQYVADDGFREAFQACMQVLGTLFLLRPIAGEAGEALAGVRAMDVAHEWPFGDDEARAQAAQLILAGADEDERTLDLEFQRLFRGTGHRAAPPFGSVYMDRDQVLFGSTWLRLRDWMRAHGVKTLYDEREPEDQIGRMMLLSAEVCKNRPDLLVELLGDHLLIWADHFFEKFLTDQRTSTYEGLAVLARATLADVQDLLGIVPARYRFYR